MIILVRFEFVGVEIVKFVLIFLGGVFLVMDVSYYVDFNDSIIIIDLFEEFLVIIIEVLMVELIIGLDCVVLYQFL